MLIRLEKNFFFFLHDLSCNFFSGHSLINKNVRQIYLKLGGFIRKQKVFYLTKFSPVVNIKNSLSEYKIIWWLHQLSSHKNTAKTIASDSRYAMLSEGEKTMSVENHVPLKKPKPTFDTSVCNLKFLTKMKLFWKSETPFHFSRNSFHHKISLRASNFKSM